MIYFLFLLCLFTWPFGQLLSFVLPGLPFSIYLLDLSVFLLFLFTLPLIKKSFSSDSLVKNYAIFILAGALSLAVFYLQSGKINPVPLLYFVRLIIYPALYFAVRHLGFSRIKLPIKISVVIFLFLGLGQYLFLPDMRFLKNLGFDDHYYRLIGSFFDPNFTGAIVTGLALWAIFNNKNFFAALLLILLALTFSRASYLSFAFGILYLLLVKRKTKLLLVLLFLSLAVVLSPKPFGEGVNLFRMFSVYSRLESWGTGLSLFIAKPLLGWGYNSLKTAIDNSFVFILATTGIMGFVAFIKFLYGIFQTQNLAVKTILLSLFIHSLFNNSLFYIWIFSFFWLVLGLGKNLSGGVDNSQRS